MTYIQASLNNGRISRWDKNDFPLPIYIEKCDNHKYNDMVIHALKEWEICSNGLIKFQEVNDLYDSKVNISWEHIDEKALGLCDWLSRDNRIFSAEIKIDLSGDNIQKRYLNDNEVYHTILHELGCAVGLGHSDDEKDIMYVPHQYGITNISNNDIQTLIYIYNMPIGLTAKQFGEQFKIDSENFDEIVHLLVMRYSEEKKDNQ